jgi:hypothetical protein
MTDLHPEYFHTRFRVDAPIERWPDRFAIVSAFATTGEAWSRERNELADKALEAELRSRGCWMLRIVGYSPRTGHAEPSWAIEISPRAARELGRRFLQDAIYLVNEHTLYLSTCEPDAEAVRVGPFPARLDSPPPAG